MSTPNLYALETQELMERLIDTHGIGEVLRSLGILCGDKADHIRASYSDKATARHWDNKSKAIFALSEKLDD
jgi:hypothetical protein